MKKGTLTQTVLRKFGRNGFTSSGDIRVSVLEKLKKSPSSITRKRANYALNRKRRK